MIRPAFLLALAVPAGFYATMRHVANRRRRGLVFAANDLGDGFHDEGKFNLYPETPSRRGTWLSKAAATAATWHLPRQATCRWGSARTRLPSKCPTRSTRSWPSTSLARCAARSAALPPGSSRRGHPAVGLPGGGERRAGASPADSHPGGHLLHFGQVRFSSQSVGGRQPGIHPVSAGADRAAHRHVNPDSRPAPAIMPTKPNPSTSGADPLATKAANAGAPPRLSIGQLIEQRLAEQRFL